VTGLRLSAVGEGISVRVTTFIDGANDPVLVLEALQNIFPEIETQLPEKPEFPSEKSTKIDFEGISLATYLEKLHQQRILDTAMDHMSRRIFDNRTTFDLSRQAALVGKVSFPIPGEIPLGGVITVELAGTDLSDWIEAATWHRGRVSIPRNIGDDFRMRFDGDAITWHREPE
jgi:predicted RNA binding protein with dsRBD fold (UPF0201 family)